MPGGVRMCAFAVVISGLSVSRLLRTRGKPEPARRPEPLVQPRRRRLDRYPGPVPPEPWPVPEPYEW
jgi:hypothetical protein